MATAAEPQPVVAKHGEKMIEVTIRFWTNDLAEAGMILPKHDWTSGMVDVRKNAAHGLGGHEPLPFQTLMDLPGKIEEVLIREGITLHPSSSMRHYLK